MHFKRMIGNGGETCKVYVEGTTDDKIIKRNIYHDVTQDISTVTGTMYTHLVYIDLQPPVKTVKGLGWWRENESLPIIAYMPWHESFTPDKGVKIVLDSEGMLNGTYVIQVAKSLGYDQACVWACNIVPYRDSGTIL